MIRLTPEAYERLTKQSRLPELTANLEKGKNGSSLEQLFVQQCHLAGVPKPEREVMFYPGRKWRFDFSWPDQLVAVEIEGGTYSHGRKTKTGRIKKSRHLTPTGFYDDCRKYNAAAAGGWRVVRADAKMVRSGEALNDLIQVLMPNNFVSE